MSNIILFKNEVDNGRREDNEDGIKPYRIAMIGDPNVGKTCLVSRWAEGEWAMHQATEMDLHVEDMYEKEIEYDALEASKTSKEYHSMVTGDELHSRGVEEHGHDVESNTRGRVCAQVIDITDLDVTAYSEIRNLQLQQADGFILCYSLTDVESLENLILYQRMITRLKGDFVPIVVCGNKSDCLVERKISEGLSMSLCEEMDIDYENYHFETSAMENNNVNEVFYTIIKSIENERQHGSLQNNLHKRSDDHLRGIISAPTTVAFIDDNTRIPDFSDNISPIQSSNSKFEVPATSASHEVSSSNNSTQEHNSKTFENIEPPSSTPIITKKTSLIERKKKRTTSLCCIIS